MTDDEARKAFDEAVNMKPRELEAWLKTEESLSVGQDRDGDGIKRTRWRYSLLNWGHDPLKAGAHPTGR